MWATFSCILLVLYEEIRLIRGQCGCCNDYRGCEGDNFIDQSTDIDCRGFLGCYHGDVTSGVLTTTNNANIFCGGYYGCGVRNVIRADGILFCRGHWGCRNVNFVIGNNGVYCTGELSCADEDPTYGAAVRSTNAFVACWGPQSCYGTSLIYAPDTTNGNIFCEGTRSCAQVNAGRVGGDIYAGESIYCRGYYSCEESRLISLTGYIWCVGEFSCESAEITTEPDALLILCEGQGSCRYSEIEAEGGGVVCTAEVSCFESEIDVSDSYLYCRAAQSCFGSSIRVDGQLFCDGSQSCMRLQGLSGSGSSASVGINAFCRSFYSCASADINTENDIFCEGSGSCASAELDIDRDTYCDGRRSCIFANIDTSNDVYCRADEACYAAHIDAGGDVYCRNENSCSNAEINVGGSIIRRRAATRRLQQSDEQNVYVYGYRGASNAYFIVSGGSTIVNFFFYGYEAGEDSVIECKSATCNLFCHGNGCNGLTFTCTGNCNVECDESMNIDCPILDDTFQPTNDPTPNPAPQVTTECDS